MILYITREVKYIYIFPMLKSLALQLQCNIRMFFWDVSSVGRN